MQNELACLLGRHEIARDILVGDCHRTALLYLSFEKRNDRPGRAKDISEPDPHEPRPVGRLVVDFGGKHRWGASPHPHPRRGEVAVPAPTTVSKHKQFGHALGGAHDIGRPHGLVGGYENEPLDAMQ